MKRILSIDGGGIRGIIPALVLAEIEKRSAKQTHELFDLVAGTSTGGILALGLCRDNGMGKAKFSAKDMSKIYQKRGKEIFARSLWKGVSSLGGIADEKYSEDGLEKVLDDYLGRELLSSSLTPVLITSYDIQNREPHFFKSWRDEWKAVEMRYAARATSAAPTYFEPALVPSDGKMRALIDGGVYINNPAMSAYAEARRIFPKEKDLFVVSLGTGELIRPIAHAEARDWGQLEWMLPLLSCVFDGVNDAVNYQLDQIMGDDFVRFQTSLSIASDDMDNATKGNIENLISEAKKLIKSHGKELDQVVKKLS